MQLSTLPLLDFVPTISPRFLAPRHLSVVAEKLERFREQPFRFVFSVPPRHGKSQLIFHWIAWALIRHPTLRIAYVTVNSTLASIQAQLCRRMCIAAGVQFTNRNETTWYVKGGGTVAWEGINGTLVGRGFDVVIIDDPVKNRLEAESPTMRERAWAFYQNDCVTRLEPGASFLCIQTRWHEDDLAGRLTQARPEEAFRPLEYVNMPALSHEDTPEELALWPEGGWDVAALKLRRSDVGPYGWSSLYQGQPRPRGAKVFSDVWTYKALPMQPYRRAIGVDLAYSEKTSADKSVAVVALRGLDDGLTYVTDVSSQQVPAPAFKRTVRALQLKNANCRVRWYHAGTEKGVASFFEQEPDKVRRFDALPASGDKFVRAQPASAAWNRGDILCPEDAPWLSEFLEVVNAFSGIKDARDDEVDALAAAFDLLEDPRSAEVKLGPAIHSPRRA